VIGGIAAAGTFLGLRLLIWGPATPDVPTALLQGMLGGAVVGAVFLAVIAIVDRQAARGLLARVRVRR
jgi:putative peptidoglycan lipid II flippase